MSNRCPCCAGTDVHLFHEARSVPVNSVLLLRSREEALGFPTGDIVLGFCRACGFIYNTAFDERLLEYSARYEETQGFSPTFQGWQIDLVDRLIERYDLQDKDIIEIGCGKGEFLALLCARGRNRGVGFDPAYRPDRVPEGAEGRVRYVQDLYSERNAQHGDFLCCKMTLEHIPSAADFVGTLRRSLGDRQTVVFFQVPDVLRSLTETAFWDIYYEHCSYYSTGSLARLFHSSGFSVVEVAREYDAQYLTIEARPGDGSPSPALAEADDLEQVAGMVDRFAERLPDKLREWRERIGEYRSAGKRVVIWGAGSAGVSFLTTLGMAEDIEYAVDINPHKHGTYIAGTGHEIVGPAFVANDRPDVVIVMNRIYRQEITAELHRLGLDPEIVTT